MKIKLIKILICIFIYIVLLQKYLVVAARIKKTSQKGTAMVQISCALSADLGRAGVRGTGKLGWLFMIVACEKGFVGKLRAFHIGKGTCLNTC